MAIELNIPGIRIRPEKRGLRTVRVSDVSEAATHTQGAALSIVDIDGTSFNGQEASLAAISQSSARTLRYSSRTPIGESHPLAHAARSLGRILHRELQTWPFITPTFQQEVERHTPEPGIYGLGKALLPPRMQRRVWKEATGALAQGEVLVVGNSNLIDGRLARALHRHAIRNGLGSDRVIFAHVKR